MYFYRTADHPFTRVRQNPVMHTDRLILRGWQDSDLEPWIAMNADPEVRQHFGSLATRDQSIADAARFQSKIDRDGWGIWAAEIKATGEFIGFVGMQEVPAGLPFTGVEIGWRLTRTAWGHGYATEGALACLDHAFTALQLAEVVAMTSTTNLPSQAVMRRIGMTYDPAADFDHPRVPEGPLRRHVLYRKHA